MALIDKLTAIGDGFRSSRGTTQQYTLDEMAVLAAEPEVPPAYGVTLTDKLTALADGFRLREGTEQRYTLDEMAILAAKVIGGGDVMPVVNLSLCDVTDGVIRNVGTGGSTYDATIVQSTGTYESNDTGLILTNTAYANVNYSFNKTTPFTICVRGSFEELSSDTYQRLIRTNGDKLSVYFSKAIAPRFRAKLSGDGSSLTAVGNVAYISAQYGCIELSTASAGFDLEHSFVYTGDTENDVISFYVDGKLYATEQLSTLINIPYIGIGADTAALYCPQKVKITDFRIWDVCLSENEVKAESMVYDDGTLLYDWDFTAGLTDSVRGASAVIGNASAVSQNETGLVFTAAGGYVTLDRPLYARNRTYEIDVASFVFGGSSSYHIRLLMQTKNKATGAIWKKSGAGYSFYDGSWDAAGFQSDKYDLTDPNVISGHTLKFHVNDGGFLTMFIDGENCGTTTTAWREAWSQLDIGSNDTKSAGSQLYNAVITGFRVYQGVV